MSLKFYDNYLSMSTVSYQDPNFVWGLGDSKDPLYGLYLPVKDRFIVVHHDLETLEDLWTLLSSKCHTVIVRISTSDDYFHNIIDNTVCDRWSIKNHQPITFRLATKTPTVTDGLRLGLRQTDPDDDLSELLKFCQLSLQILVALHVFKKLPLLKLCRRLYDYDSEMLFTPRKILDLHDDAITKCMSENLESRIQDLERVRDELVRQHEHLIYWAKDAETLRQSYKQTCDIIDPKWIHDE